MRDPIARPARFGAMSAPTPFTFAIPLVGRAAAADFALVEALLSLTLRSVLAQTDPDFAVLVLGHDRPSALPDDPRVRFVAADWPCAPQDPANDDAGRKRHRLGRLAAARGAGFLMLLDADDLVSRDLVARARAEIPPDAIGGVVAHGAMLDLATARMAGLPLPGVYERPFYTLCGSSVVARLRPGDPDPLRADPLCVLRDHHCWPEAAHALGAQVVALSARACYLVGTGASHSERHGPFAAWRAMLNEAVRTIGRPADGASLAGYGIDAPALARLTVPDGRSSQAPPPPR